TSDDSCVFENESGGSKLLTRSEGKFCVWPDFEKTPAGFKKSGLVNKNAATDLDEILFACYEPEEKSAVDSGCKEISFGEASGTDEGKAYSLDLSFLLEKLRKGKESHLSDVFVKISYTGNEARLYEVKDGKRKLLLDHFYLGEDYPWEIGLKRFVSSDLDFSRLELEITPLKKGEKIYIEKWPEINGNEIAILRSVTWEQERAFSI
ncbi:MAG: beta-galactosidase, partial [Treponema sp.]|nr:beta-galactosidase [Treponema sp.]